MIPGHTKFLCDGYFGNIKQKYKYAKINTIEDIVKQTMHYYLKKNLIGVGMIFNLFLKIFKHYLYHHFRFNNA